MDKPTKFSILHIITENDLVKFHEKVKEYEKDKKIIEKKIYCSVIPIGAGNGQMGTMGVFQCYFEIEVNEQAYKTWKFGQNLKLT